MSTGCNEQKRKKVTAEDIAALLANEEWTGRSRRRVDSFARRATCDRDGGDVLPCGHPISWGALWHSDVPPPFPGLTPMGNPGTGHGGRSGVAY